MIFAWLYAPTQGYFEKAYIEHGSECSSELPGCDPDYEYMVVVKADQQQIEQYAQNKPYSVLRADKTAHIVKDNVTGIVGCAAFQTTSVDEIIAEVSPSVMMYRAENDMLEMSVSNPDLSLYQGESDEIFDVDGKRIERSVYGRKWINNPAGETFVNIVLNGEWEISDKNNNKISVRFENERTMINFVCFESDAMHVKLRRKSL